MKRWGSSQISKLLFLLISLSFLLVSLLFPLTALFSKVFFTNREFVGLKNFQRYFSTPGVSTSVNHSFFIAFTTSIIVILIAFWYVYAIERSGIKGKKIYKWIALLPLFAPTMTHGIALIYLFGSKGIITSGFFGKLPWITFNFPLYGRWGVVFAEAIYVFPAVYLMLSIAFKGVDYRLYEAAEVMSTSDIKKFFTITLPGVKYGIISAFFSAFTMVFTDFGAPKVVGGNYNLLATDVFKQVIGQQNVTLGATIGMLLIIPSIIAFAADRVISKRNIGVDSKARPYIIKENKVRDLIFTIFNIITAAVISVLFITIIFAAFVKRWPYDLSFTLQWFKIKTLGKSVIEIYRDTIFVALISAILGTIITIISSYSSERVKEFKFLRGGVKLLSLLPLALPGLVVGLSFVLHFNNKSNPLSFIYGTFGILILANMLHFYSVPFLTLTGNMQQLDREYENLSESLGIPWYNVFVKVIIPMSKVAIVESFSYLFINSMMTVSAVTFLYTTKTKVASVEMIDRYDAGDVSTAAAIAVLTILTNIVFKYIIEKLKGLKPVYRLKLLTIKNK